MKPRALVRTPAAGRFNAIRVGDPTNCPDGKLGLGRGELLILARDHADTCGDRFEARDLAEMFAHLDAVFPKGACDLPRNVAVLGGNDSRPRLTERDPRSKCVEDRRYLRARRTGADNDERFRNLGQTERIRRRHRQFGARSIQCAAAPPEQRTILLPRSLGPNLLSNRHCIGQSARSRHARTAQRRPSISARGRWKCCTGLGDDFVCPADQTYVIDRRRIYRDSVTRKLACLAHETGRVR